MGKEYGLISDHGVIERKDVLGKMVITVSIIMSCVLIVLGVLALVNP